MTEQRGTVVAWLRRIIRRGSNERDDINFPGEAPAEEVNDTVRNKPEPVSAYETTAASSDISPSGDVKVRIETEPPKETPSPATAHSGEPSAPLGPPSGLATPTAPSATLTPGHGAGGLHPKVAKHLTDNASVMTIASSSKRRRRSLDTNASTRAMAAESIFSWADSADVQSQMSKDHP